MSEASEADVRTLGMLECTVDYLLGWVFAYRAPPAVEDACDADDGGVSGGVSSDGRAGTVRDDRWGNEDPNEISIWEDGTPIKDRKNHRERRQRQQQQQQDIPLLYR